MSNIKKASYEAGYKRGRLEGFEQGRLAGRAAARAHRSLPALPNILVITPHSQLPTLHIVVKQPLEALARRGLYDYTVKTEDEVSRSDIERACCIVFVRNVEPSSYHYLNMARQLGKPTVYCIDDNFLEIPQSSQLAPYYNRPDIRETFQKFLREAGVVKTDSSYFASWILQNYNPNTIYFPSSVDFGMIDQWVKPKTEDGQLVIGYGGTFKEDDFAVVVPALQQILAQFEYVRLEFCGYAPEVLMRHPKVRVRLDEQDYRSYMHYLFHSAWDIGLAPLSDSPFNRCKTNNKFREYAACGIPGLYSRHPVYEEWVSHGESGWLVPHTTEGWLDGLWQLITNGELRNKILHQANAVSRQQFHIDGCADRWLEMILRRPT